VVDELGTLTYAEIDRRTNALARGLPRARHQGRRLRGDPVPQPPRLRRDDGRAGQARRHCLYFNTGFAAPQIADVAEREEPVALVYDEEFSEMVGEAAEGRKRFIGWFEGPDKPDCPIVDDLATSGDAAPLDAPEKKGRFVILTSGTTGTPKGASRETPDSLAPVAALFDKIPMRAEQTIMIAAPLFHSWGFLHFNFALGLGSTIVLRRKFDPEMTLSDTAQHQAHTLAVVPVMLSRILELGEETIKKYDLSALRTINASGSALPGELADRVMDAFGDVLYNLYGSTEVAWATIATPEDLRAAPGTAGRPPRNTGRQALRRERQGGRQGRDRPHLRRQRDAVRGLHRRRQQGPHRRAHVQRRRRPLRRGRAAVRRRPRRRDDRLGRRERLPARGRGPARRASEHRRGGGHRRRGREVRPGSSRRSWVRRRSLSEDDVKGPRQGEPANYKVPKQVVFLDELPAQRTGKVVKKASKGRTTTPRTREDVDDTVLPSGMPARTDRSTSGACAQRRGPPLELGVRLEPFAFGGQTYAVPQREVPASVDLRG
jgi:fatty-acyl-CoA synthase